MPLSVLLRVIGHSFMVASGIVLLRTMYLDYLKAKRKRELKQAKDTYKAASMLAKTILENARKEGMSSDAA